MLTFQSPTIHCIVYFYPGPLGLEMLYQWKRCSTALWINRTVHSSFFFLYHSPSSRREVTLMRMCIYSVLFCLSRGTWKSVRLRQHALPGLHYAFSYHCLIVSLRRDVTIGTKSLLGVQPFWGMSSCPVVQMCVLSSGDAERCKPVGLFSCLPTLWMSSV